ncbi:hypothetical protein ACMD2_24657 [Ananas comosus]|uniref:Uncharacterized protein n=1 Tax=Ananas comosus TaxID=4615 RepID=A0A199VA76_ANACO|nr:hypothetical protein ACMD2_24657 [Ananas comosus]
MIADLEGIVRRPSCSLFITAFLIDAKEKLANWSGTSESSQENVIAMENKIYIEVIRKEYGGRVGGLGLIPFESCVCYNSESTEEVQKLREEVQENKKMDVFGHLHLLYVSIIKSLQ